MTARSHRKIGKPAKRGAAISSRSAPAYDSLVGGIAGLLEEAGRTSARAINALMTGTYWEIGRRIVEFEQAGKARAEYGGAVIERLAADLTRRFGRGFSRQNLWQIRAVPSGLARRSPRAGAAGRSEHARDSPDSVWRIRGAGNRPDAVGRISSPRRPTRRILDPAELERVFRDELTAPLRAVGLEAEVFVWDDFRDRYLLSNLIGITLPNGFDTTRNPRDITTWTRLGRTERDDIQREFEEASRRHALRGRFRIP